MSIQNYNRQIEPQAFDRYLLGLGNKQNLDEEGEFKEFESAQEKERELEQKRGQDMFMQGLSQQQILNAQRGNGMMMPYNTNQLNGYGNLNSPEQFNMETILPFDDSTDKARNYQGIVNSFNPQLFQVSESIIQNTKSLHPLAQETLREDFSMYQENTENFAFNRLYIINQRNRENNVYSFV